jgi:hypothetical protein
MGEVSFLVTVPAKAKGCGSVISGGIVYWAAGMAIIAVFFALTIKRKRHLNKI